MSEVAAIILAAGLSSRYRAAGGAEASKLIADFRGEPLVRAVARAALASRAQPVIVVTGHARAEVEAALAGLSLTFAHNPNFASGLASSLRTGIAATPGNMAGTMVLLGDMPEIEAATIDRVLEAFRQSAGALAAVPVFSGQRGNPVILGRALFAAVARLEGDEGARRLLRDLGDGDIVEIVLADPAVTRDVDTPADRARVNGDMSNRPPPGK